LEGNYKVCILDGRKELVGNFKIEPPGLFRGRGKHPKTGKLKVFCYEMELIIDSCSTGTNYT
jgi:DNA topoisomerase IB